MSEDKISFASYTLSGLFCDLQARHPEILDELANEFKAQKFCNRATKAFVALAHQMPSSFRNSWSRFTDSVLQRLIPRGVITEVVFTQSNHSRT